MKIQKFIEKSSFKDLSISIASLENPEISTAKRIKKFDRQEPQSLKDPEGLTGKVFRTD